MNSYERQNLDNGNNLAPNGIYHPFFSEIKTKETFFAFAEKLPKLKIL